MFRKMFFILLLIPITIFAQSSGKLAGVVVDKSTGEPLPGVNVILEGTTQGSSTDIDGYYVILNVPVGVYTMRANYIGYKDYVVQNVRVSAGITTEINFSLEPTTLELEEAIVVTAERPLVEKNITSSVSLLTSKEIENVPVRGL
ncbi:MAG: carboxypeptidase-like regulatory domain-containing protein, partial [Calditrichia bacterium]